MTFILDITDKIITYTQRLKVIKYICLQPDKKNNMSLRLEFNEL